MVLLLVLLTYTAGCLDDEGDDDNGDDEPEEVLANAGTNVVGVVGEPVTFNASTSSGPIVRYTWGITVNATSPNITVLEGVEAEYTFNEAGKYLVTLTIVGDKDQNDSITIHAFIDHIKSISGTVTLTERTSPCPTSWTMEGSASSCAGRRHLLLRCHSISMSRSCTPASDVDGHHPLRAGIWTKGL
jgi:hypothetical protein